MKKYNKSYGKCITCRFEIFSVVRPRPIYSFPIVVVVVVIIVTDVLILVTLSPKKLRRHFTKS